MQQFHHKLKLLVSILIGMALFGNAAAAPPSNPGPAAGYWAFKPLSTQSLPHIRLASSVRNQVDFFVQAELERKRIPFAAEAGTRSLIRRVTFDLIGLPPTPAEVEQFVHDPDPKAYEKLVDRLLSSPHFGERWGRRWLDLARYADSDGQESDEDRPTAYHYRDFVIRALNDDMPYNTFVRWQLAGDEYAPENPLAISATGFLVAGTHANLDSVAMAEEKVREHYNELDDIVSTTGQTFLGLTFGCARCHDHKYDPIPTRDYYRMLAVFNSCDRREVALVPQPEADRLRAAESTWKSEVAAAKKAGDKAAISALESRQPPIVPTAYAVAESGSKPRESWLLDRGDFHRLKEPVELGFVSTLCQDRSPHDYWSDARAAGGRSNTTYQRRAMAEWITDSEHGAGALLARVIANRLWQGHFGEGLVRTVNDFGKRCDPPSNPALLEWLSAEIVRSGWKLKPIHRMIVLSAAYRRDITSNPTAARIDPENRLLWRRTPRRIESEIFRDSMLAAAGSLNLELYGPAFKPPIQPEAMQARNLKSPYPSDARDSLATRRRTVYIFHKRVVQHPLLQAFDDPDASASCGRRSITTVPTQALAVLNEPFVRLRAAEFASRLRSEAGSDANAQTRLAYMLALGRPPTNAEIASSTRFLQRQTAARAARESQSDAERRALVDFAQVIFGLNEFMYVD